MSKVKISAGIFPIDQFGKIGKIHSVFERSFNIKVENRLINVASYQGYLASFGLSLDAESYQKLIPYIQTGNIVKLGKNGLTLYSHQGVYLFTWEKSECIQLQVPSLRLNQRQLGLLSKVLNEQRLEEKIGLVPTSRVQQAFSLMSRRQPELTIAEWREILALLIGRGKGLTPSGDDILVAYLVLLQLCQDSRSDALRSAFLQTDVSTTDISKEYLYYALQGYVNSHVYRLLIHLQENASKQQLTQDVLAIMQIGHSSGNDLCFGMLLAIR